LTVERLVLLAAVRYPWRYRPGADYVVLAHPVGICFASFRSVTVGQVAEAVLSADFFCEEGDRGQFTPVLRDVEMPTSRVRRNADHVRTADGRRSVSD
jgi:hypothetical protein